MSGRPAVGRDRRVDASNRCAANASRARYPALARSWLISPSRIVTCRPTSAWLNAGRVIASASSSTAGARCDTGTEISTCSASELTSTPYAAPCRSSAAANSLAECSSVPSSSVRDMIVATPSRSRGSAISGIPIVTRTVATYCPGRSKTCTGAPTLVRVVTASGNLHGRGAPTAGGVVRTWLTLAPLKTIRYGGT